jgi:4-hydroxythreonine-4-phosphate dehydrogenase
MSDRKPVIALMLGDRNGIGPEVCAKVVGGGAYLDSCAALVLVGDARVYARGCAIAGVDNDIPVVSQLPGRAALKQTILLDTLPPDATAPDPQGLATAESGREMLNNLAFCFDLVRQDMVDGVVVAPLNKAAMRLGGLGAGDELDYLVRRFGITADTCELNELKGFWTSRVTAHIPLREVADHITIESVSRSIGLMDRTLRGIGKDRRIAVAGLNPHAGESGAFGSEEIEIIGPAVAQCRESGIDVSGPFPADTIFVRAQKEGIPAVVTMYHDQGQIALKILGFGKGVTVMAGLPFPWTTPSHGTAYDIAGKGMADPTALSRAIALCASLRRPRSFPT